MSTEYRHITFQIKRSDSTEWATKNPVLRSGEPAIETDTGKYKIGDGVTAWLDLKYYKPYDPDDSGGWEDALFNHVNAAEPHPAYDDGPSLELLYENAKV